MTHAQLLSAVYHKLGTIAGIPSIAYPNIDFTPTNDYVAVYVLPAETTAECLDNLSYKSGIIQVDCVVPSSVGEIKAAEYADIILSEFKNGTVITDGVLINRPPFVSAGFNMGNGYYKIPVNIRYRLYDLA